MLTVQLPHHSYQIQVKKGGLNQVGRWVADLWQPQKIAIITDETVDGLYGEEVLQQLQVAGFDVYKIAIPAGEPSKSLAQAEKLFAFLASHQFTRSDGIVALGGGVIGDLAGFVAATYMRGIHFLQVPTTLLAQVDSSIGGKTAVNTTSAKNLVGAFWHPDGVLIDPLTLTTLPKRRIREGIAEIVKSAAIADETLWQTLSELPDEEALLAQAEAVITACLQVKKSVVEEDELDNGRRLILNFGHTIGHAIENSAGYGVVSHGEGVSLGMVQISRVAEEKALMPEGITADLIQMLTKFNLPTDATEWDEAALYQALTHDKKTRGTTIKIVLLTKIGEAKILDVTIEEMREFLRRELV